MGKGIDFVVLWVDDTDLAWQKKRDAYHGNVDDSLNHISRYRDWGIFKYWFRGIEKYAPWVNKVHLVTAGQKPDWLYCGHPKLNVVDHTDFIDDDFLPTFSSRPIELNLHRIPGLSENFVYFNDDMFIVNDVMPTMFFKRGLPADYGVRNPVSATPYGYVQYNVLQTINRHLGHIDPVLKRPGNWLNPRYGTMQLRTLLLFPWTSHLGFKVIHGPTSYLKTDFKRVWAAEPDLLCRTCSHRFRTSTDVNQQIIRWWRLVENRFSPVGFHKISLDIDLQKSDDFLKYIVNQSHPVICLNDNETTDFQALQPKIKGAFSRLFPEKSAFEL